MVTDQLGETKERQEAGTMPGASVGIQVAHCVRGAGLCEMINAI